MKAGLWHMPSSGMGSNFLFFKRVVGYQVVVVKGWYGDVPALRQKLFGRVQKCTLGFLWESGLVVLGDICSLAFPPKDLPPEPVSR
jgi:hypothetical protein